MESFFLSGTSPVVVYGHRKRPVEPVQVQTPDATGSEYFLKVTGPAKALKESAMHKLFRARYEEEPALIIKGINTEEQGSMAG